MYNVLTRSSLREVCKVKPRLELQTRGKYGLTTRLSRCTARRWRHGGAARDPRQSACRHTLAASINNLGALLQDKWATSLRLSRCTARPWRGSARPRQLASEHAHLPQANNLGALLQKMDDHGGHAIKMKGGGAHSAARPVLDIRGKMLATADKTPPLSDGAVAGATALCAVGRMASPSERAKRASARTAIDTRRAPPACSAALEMLRMDVGLARPRVPRCRPRNVTVIGV